MTRQVIKSMAALVLLTGTCQSGLASDGPTIEDVKIELSKMSSLEYGEILPGSLSDYMVIKNLKFGYGKNTPSDLKLVDSRTIIIGSNPETNEEPTRLAFVYKAEKPYAELWILKVSKEMLKNFPTHQQLKKGLLQVTDEEKTIPGISDYRVIKKWGDLWDVGLGENISSGITLIPFASNSIDKEYFKDYFYIHRIVDMNNLNCGEFFIAKSKKQDLEEDKKELKEGKKQVEEVSRKEVNFDKKARKLLDKKSNSGYFKSWFKSSNSEFF